RSPGGKGTEFGKRLAALDNELFAHHARTAGPGTLVLTAYLVALAALAAAGRLRHQQGRGASAGQPSEDAGPLFPAVFAALLLGAYLVVPDHLGESHGGFLLTRLAPLPFLLALACLREPTSFGPRLVSRWLTTSLLVINLPLVAATTGVGNEEL